jgi:hypothetical protein
LLGTTYYWAIVPDNGTCLNGYFKFVASTNLPPVLEALTDRSADVGSEITIQAKGSDPDPYDGVNLTFSLGSGSPDGLTIDPKSGKITWTPGSAQAGRHKVTVRLTDTKDTVERSFYITVNQRTHVSMAAEWPLLLILLIIIACVSAVVVWRLKKKENIK